MASWGHHLVAGDIQNIVARLKGQHSGKAVLLAAHYDSQPNARGAGDDGAGVAAMLETARLLKSGRPLKNDVIFLFTDGEEDGLLGAQAFVTESPLLKDVGVVLNWEGRGNCGISMMFETNPGNGWVVNEFARAAAHPFANSLNYEVYRSLPNNTDYSLFKHAGVAGLNNAYIEGFVNYHSMTDKPENLDMRSFQDHGDNMLSLTKHFGNIDLSDTVAPDLSYFNILSDWLIRYPASWNLYLLIFGNLVLVGCMTLGFVKKAISVRGFIGGVIGFPGVLFILYGVGDLLLKMIRSAYPLYDHFYAANSYNVYYYFFALTALAVAIFTGAYQWMLRKFSEASLMAGILLIEVAGLDVFYTKAPTAIYFLFFPLLSTMIFYILSLLFKRVRKVEIVSYALPALLLMAPVVYYFFVAFGLESPSSVAVVVLGLLLGLLLPVLANVLRTSRWLIPVCSFSCFLITMGVAHLQSGYTDSEPLQTNLRYLLNTDEGRAYWVSDDVKPDRWNRQFFTHPSIGNSIGNFDRGLIDDAPLVDLAPLSLLLEHDTLEAGVRKLRLHCLSRLGVVSARMLFSEGGLPLVVKVNGKEVAEKDRPKTGWTTLEYKGLGAEGVDIECWTSPGRPFEFYLLSRSMGLPEIKGTNTSYPADIIPGPGDHSNTTQVAKRYVF
jgi:hypothetical protein